MRLSGSRLGGGGLGRLCALVVVLVCAGLLASCAATSGAGTPTKRLFGGNPNKGLVTVPNDDSFTPEMFLATGYCPPVQIRPGTEALVVYEKGHEDDPNYIRFQGSLGEMARECHVVGQDTLSIKVGIAGRITAGPKGGAGSVTATLRVVVLKQHGNTVLYSEAFKVPATIAAPDFSGAFSQVVQNVTLKLGPGDRDLIIYVGFDEGKPKPAPTG